MANQIWIALLCACPMLACGGSARNTHDAEASAGNGVGAAGNIAGAAGNIAGAAGSSGGDSPRNVEAGAAGDSEGGAGGSANGVHLSPGSWDVTADVSAEPKSFALCDHLAFALTVDGETMTIGHDGELYSTDVQIVDGDYVASSVDFPRNGCSTPRLFAKELRLHGIDQDGDGEADQLEATAVLEQTVVWMGDTGMTVTPTLKFTAQPDQSTPTLLIGTRSDLNPLNGISLSASEPLVTSTTVALTGTSTVPLPATKTNGMPAPNALISFATTRILPLGGTWQITATGKDLAGHALELDAALNSLSTSVDPGVQAQDGFEGALSGASASARSVTGYGTISALSGTHSLWLDAGSAFLVHLQRAVGQKNIHFVARAFSGLQSAVYTAKNVRAGVVGGTQVVGVAQTPVAGSPISASGEASLPWVSDTMHFDAVLDEPGADVILSISNGFCAEPVLCGPTSAWLIDDLKID